MVISSEFPRTFTKVDPETRQVRQRLAKTPAQVVRLKFDGWQEQTPAAPASGLISSATQPGKPPVKAAGKPAPERKDS